MARTDEPPIGAGCAGTRVSLVRPLTNSELNSPFFLPLGLLCVGSALSHAGHFPKILDYEFLHRSGRFVVDEGSYLEDFCIRILNDNPQIIGLSVLADTLPLALLMTDFIKRRRPEVITVLGGPGVFAVPFQQLLDKFPHAADYICKREGELPIVALANAVSYNIEHPELPGMVALRNGSYFDYGHRDLADLDSLPRPAYDLVPLEEYLALATPRIFDLYVGAGCTFGCKFCTTASFWSKQFRAKSPKRVLAEMDELHAEYGITKFNLLHDNFSNSKAYLSAFIEYFISYNRKYQWGCACRPDSLTPDLLSGMKAAGCFTIFTGTDSGSSSILRSMAKAANTKRFYESFTNCKEIGIKLETNTIIGYPDERDSDFEDSLCIVFDCVAYGSTSSDVSILQPLPGAPVTESNKEHLVHVENPLTGNFLPGEVLSVVRASPSIFPGFSFIKNGNRDYGFYVEASKLVKYFTRHYFASLFFLKHACKINYLTVFLEMHTESDPAEYAARFLRLAIGLAGMCPAMPIFRDVLRYDQALDELKCVNVEKELTNTYASPERWHTENRCILVDTDYDVVALVGQFPLTPWEQLAKAETTYLLYSNSVNQIVTLRLKPWQKRLWQGLQTSPSHSPKLIEDTVQMLRLTECRKRSIQATREAVMKAADTFLCILQNAEVPLSSSCNKSTFELRGGPRC